MSARTTKKAAETEAETVKTPEEIQADVGNVIKAEAEIVAVAESLAVKFCFFMDQIWHTMPGLNRIYGNAVKTAVNYWGARVTGVKIHALYPDDEVAEDEAAAETLALRMQFPDESHTWVSAEGDAFIAGD